MAELNTLLYLHSPPINLLVWKVSYSLAGWEILSRS